MIIFINNSSSPVIILGMHRSGTTMIASMLKDLGLNIGNDLEENKESIKFLSLNDWILSQSGGSWDNPSTLKYLLNSKKHADLICDYLKVKCNTGISFSENLKYIFKYIFPNNSQLPWGWKDPRTVFTLPFWLKVFPNAKIIYVYRNGVDVAASLRTREIKLVNNARNIHFQRKKYRAYSFFNKRGGFGWSPRCMQLDGAFALWEEYVLEAEKNISDSKLDCLEIRFEDFILNPTHSLKNMTTFCGLAADDDMISKIALACNSERANTFKNDAELVEFYNTVKDRPLMAKLGYSDILDLGL